MKLLALDTCSLYGSVALLDGETLVAELTTLGGLNRNEHLLPLLEHLLSTVGWTLNSLDAYAVVRGPGSFTGLRVGLATIQGLALATGKPAYGLSSLHAMARGLPHAAYPIVPVLDARKNEVYTGLYRWRLGELECLLPDQVITAKRFAELLVTSEHVGPVIVMGDGAQVLLKELDHHSALQPLTVSGSAGLLRASSVGATVLALLRAGRLDALEPASPLYLRSSDADLKLGPAGPVQTLESLGAPPIR